MSFFKKCNCIPGSNSNPRPRPTEKRQRHNGVSYTYCPSCSYRIRVSAPQAHQQLNSGDKPEVAQGVIPEGLPAEILLSNSPAAQILLTDKNRVQYANKAAIHLLGSTKNHNFGDVEDDDLIHEGRNTSGMATPLRLQRRTTTGTPLRRRTKSTLVGTRLEEINDPNELSESTVYSLEGLALKELPIDLDAETRRWISLEQMIENIKLSLRKESERIMQDLDDEAGYKGKDDDYYKSHYDIEDKSDQITEYYAAIAERDARKDEEEKHKQADLVPVAEKDEAAISDNSEQNQQPVKQVKTEPVEDSKADPDIRVPKEASIKSGVPSGIGKNEPSVLEIDLTDEFGSNTLIANQSIPVIISRVNHRTVTAKVYVSVILPGGGGGASITRPYTSLSILPSDANFPKEDEGVEKQGALSPVKKADPSPTGAAAKVIEKVTRLKDMILDEMDYFFMCLTPDGDLCVTNKATKELLGVAGETSVGEGIEWITRLDIFREDFSERLPFDEWALNTMMQDGKPVAQMIGMYTQPPNPRRLSLQLRGKPLWKDESKKEMLAALAVVVDQTEFSAREKLAKRRNDIKNSFLKMVEWKIKTPISGCVGLLNMLYQTPGLGDEQKEFVENMYRTMNTLMLVVKELSNFSQLEQNKLALDKNLFSVRDLINDLQRLCEFSFIKENIEFHFIADGILPQTASKDTADVDQVAEQFDIEEMSMQAKAAEGIEIGNETEGEVADSVPQSPENSGGKDLIVIGDEGKLRGILIYLLSNAFKFTHQGHVTFTIQREGEIEKGIQNIRFEVKDTGVGFSKETQRKLFLSFDEVISGDGGIPNAAGLGYAIAKSHADLLGAEMGCTSEPDKGSTFYLIVPLEVAPHHAKITLEANRSHDLTHDLGLVIRTDELQEPGRSISLHDESMEEGSRRLSVEGKNILIVEDNWAHQVVTEKRLRMMGCVTKIAVNGEDALTLLKKGTFAPDIILMDLQMPMLDGFQTSQKIRTDLELEKFKHVPIIAVTASESSGDRQKATDVGIDDFTMKPLHAEYLKVLLEMALKKGLERVAAAKIIEEVPKQVITTREEPHVAANSAAEVTDYDGEVSLQSLEQEIHNEDSRTIGSIESVAVSAASTARSARATQIIAPGPDAPELTLTSATPIESD